MAVPLAALVIVLVLGGFYVHVLWWIAPVVSAMWLVALIARVARSDGAHRATPPMGSGRPPNARRPPATYATGHTPSTPSWSQTGRRDST